MVGTPCLRIQASSAVSCSTCCSIWARVCSNPVAIASARHARKAPLNCSELWSTACSALRAKPPLGRGSGKPGTPCERIHETNASTSDCATPVTAGAIGNDVLVEVCLPRLATLDEPLLPPHAAATKPKPNNAAAMWPVPDGERHRLDLPALGSAGRAVGGSCRLGPKRRRLERSRA